MMTKCEFEGLKFSMDIIKLDLDSALKYLFNDSVATYEGRIGTSQRNNRPKPNYDFVISNSSQWPKDFRVFF